MAYFVDRVVICDAFAEPEAHYQLLPGGRSRRVSGRRPSMRFLASARDSKGGIAGVVGKEASLFEDMLASPNILARNRQAIPLNARRDDCLGEDVAEEGRFVPASVIRGAAPARARVLMLRFAGCSEAGAGW